MLWFLIVTIFTTVGHQSTVHAITTEMIELETTEYDMLTELPGISIEDGTATLVVYNITLEKFVNDTDVEDLFKLSLATYIDLYCVFNTTECPQNVAIGADDIMIVNEDLFEEDPDILVPVYVANQDQVGTALLPSIVIEDAVEAYADEIYQMFGYRVLPVRDDDDDEDSGLETWELALIIGGSILGFFLLLAIISCICIQCRKGGNADTVQWAGPTMELTSNSKTLDMQDIIAHNSGTPTLNTYSSTETMVSNGHSTPVEQPVAARVSAYSQGGRSYNSLIHAYDNVSDTASAASERRYV